MNFARKIRVWLGQVVQRPSDLFDITCGLTTMYFVSLVAWNHYIDGANTASIPSMSFLLDLAPLGVWLSVMGIAAVCQPLTLYFDDPKDSRHPVIQPVKWARNLVATILGSWFSILYLSSLAVSGLNHIQALYFLMMVMNLYIVGHVMFRPRIGNSRKFA